MDVITFLTTWVFFCFMNFQLASSGLITNSRKTALQDQNDEKEFGLNFTDARKIYGDKYKFCGTSDDTAEYELEEMLQNYDDGSDNIRVKRAYSSGKRKKIYVAIFVDNSFYEHIKSTTTTSEAYRETNRRVRSIMNQVESIFNYSSLQMKFRFPIARLEIFKSRQYGPHDGYGDIDKYLENFCHWQNQLTPRYEWDHSILLTAKELYRNTNGGKIYPVGLAYTGTMCRTEWSCSLTKGTTFEAAFVTAHEIGHSLGIAHDGVNNNCDSQKFIMGASTGSEQLHWSTCTNTYINNFFASKGSCILDDDSPPRKLEAASLPGMKYSLTDQCAIAYGQDSRPYKNYEKYACKELWCTSQSLIKAKHPALEGSSCDNGKICLEGRCSSYSLG